MSGKYARIAEQIERDFLASYAMTLDQAQSLIARWKELNTPTCLMKTVEQLMTPVLSQDQECVVYLVRELDTADAKRKAQIKYQLKNYYHFDRLASYT